MFESTEGYSLEEMATLIVMYIKTKKGIAIRIDLDVNNDKEVGLFIKAFDIAHRYFYGHLPKY